MKVLAHPDPFVLEEELVRRTGEALEAGPLGRLLVLVPTLRLGQHVQRRLARHLSACLGVDVLTHHALVQSILASRGQPSRPASPRLLGTLLGRVLDRLRGNRWARFAAERPSAVPALLATLTDLREAGIDPETARKVLGGGPEAPLLEVYEAWCAALAERAPHGLADRAGLVRSALPFAADHAARYGAILHHGAYELIGVHRDLVRSLDAGAPVTFLLPAEPGAPAWAYAERFVRAHLRAGVERLPGGIVSPLGMRLTSLYDEEARPDPAPEGSVVLRHAQGARDEVQAALHSALDAVASGVPAPGIVLLGRTLRPYGAVLEEAFDRPGDGGALPWTTSLAAPLRRHTPVRDLILLLRVVADDFPRAATSELLRSRHLRWAALRVGLPPPVETVEVWSRAARVVGGLEEWATELPRWAGTPHTFPDMSDEELAAAEERARERSARAERIVAGLRALARAVEPAPRRWAGHAAHVEGLMRDLLPGEAMREDPAVAALAGLVEEMRGLELLAGDARRVPFAEMVDWLERAVDAAELPVRPGDDGGPRVLDAMQARGLTFERVLWLGFQSGIFPRPPREDPFLPDAARRRLRDAAEAPLPVKAEGEEEERVLLALLLASARERVEISWQRSDEEGRPRNPSLALREVARVVLGGPDAAEWAKEERARIRSHPRDMLRGLAGSHGLLSPSEDLLLVALESAGYEGAEEALRARCAELDPGLQMLRATETPAPGDLRYDGRIGPARAAAAASLSVSALEQLGRCPLQYFFRRRLGVPVLEEEAGPFELSVLEMGNRVHRVLERAYRRLRDEGWFDPARDGLHAAARDRIAAAWAGETADLAARLRRRAPVLWSVEESRWLEALQGFVAEDLSRLRETGARPTGLEEPRSRALPLGPGLDVTISGRFDRVLDLEDGVLVGDYKTSGNVQKRGSQTEMLRGQQLQVPLYRLLAGGEARVELLGVGPEFWGKGRRAEEKLRHVAFAGFKDAAGEAGLRETLRVLLVSRRDGRFPMIIDDGGHCRWCDFRRACRRNHPPTRNREEVAPDSADVRDLARKTTKGGKVLLEQVRGGEP